MSLIVRVGADIRGLQGKLRSGMASVRNWSRQIGGLTRGLFTALSVGGGAMGLAGSMREAFAFGKGIAQVNTLLGLSRGEIRELQKDVSDVARELGLRLPDAAKAAYDAVSAGVPRANLRGFLDVAGRAAIAGATDLTTAVDGLTTVLNAFGMDAGDAETVADRLFQTVKDGKVTFQELSENVSKLAPIAKAAGLTLDEMAAAMATALKVEKPERAMTALATALTTATKNGQNLLDVARKMQGASLEEILGAGFDKRAAQGVLLLASNYSTLRDELERMAAASGEMGKAFEIMAEDSTHKLTVALGELRAAGVAIAGSTLPGIASAATAVANAVSSAMGAVNGLTEALDEQGRKLGEIRGVQFEHLTYMERVAEASRAMIEARPVIGTAAAFFGAAYGAAAFVPSARPVFGETTQSDVDAGNEARDARMLADAFRAAGDAAKAADADMQAWFRGLDKERETAEKITSAVQGQIDGLRRRVELQRMIEMGMEREAFILAELWKLEKDRKLSADERLEAIDLAGGLYDSMQAARGSDDQAAPSRLRESQGRVSALESIGAMFGSRVQLDNVPRQQLDVLRRSERHLSDIAGRDVGDTEARFI